MPQVTPMASTPADAPHLAVGGLAAQGEYAPAPGAAAGGGNGAGGASGDDGSGAAPLSAERVVEGAAEALELLRMLGAGLRHLSQYESDEAVRCFRSLPEAQLHTGWAQMCLGRAFAEQGAYADAHAAYDAARAISPSLLEGVEYFSTVLWQRRKEVALSYLAQEALATDRLAPQAWCASGNSLSLARDHEGALRCFKRALSLDPDLAYAHSLCGHELLASDDFEGAQAAFRAALRVDARHYNAWCGCRAPWLRNGPQRAGPWQL